MNMKFNIGETVRYSHKFLKSINADYDISLLTGVVESIKSVGNKTIVKVLWSDGELQSSLSDNLAHINFDVTE
jgi:hypothetical protein